MLGACTSRTRRRRGSPGSGCRARDPPGLRFSSHLGMLLSCRLVVVGARPMYTRATKKHDSRSLRLFDLLFCHPSHPLGKVTKGRSEMARNAVTRSYAARSCRVIGSDRPGFGQRGTKGGTIDQGARPAPEGHQARAGAGVGIGWPRSPRSQRPSRQTGGPTSTRAQGYRAGFYQMGETVTRPRSL